MKIRLYILFFMNVLLIACTGTNNKEEVKNNENEILITQTELVWNRLLSFEDDANLKDSPMEYYADAFQNLTQLINSDLNTTHPNNQEIIHKILFLKLMANSTQIDSLMNEEIQSLLTFDPKEELTKEEIKSRLLESNYLFMLQMTTALERIKQHIDTIPYMISDSELISKNQEMAAVLIIPNRDLIEFITFINDHDSIKISAENNHFIRVLAEPRGEIDSISAALRLQGDKEKIFLTKHYRIIP